MPKGALLNRYLNSDTSRESKRAAFATVDASLAVLREKGEDALTMEILAAVSAFKASRAGFFGGASNTIQEGALTRVQVAVTGACAAAGRTDDAAVNGLLDALFVLAKNAGGSAKIPQALQAIFVKYAPDAGGAKKSDPLAFARGNLSGARGGAYLQPARAAAASVPTTRKQVTYADVSASEDVTNKYLPESTRYRIFRHAGAIYAVDHQRPLAAPVMLWSSGKDRPGKPSREERIRSDKPFAKGSTADVFVRAYNPEKVTKVLHEGSNTKGRNFFYLNGDRFRGYNDGILEMAFACAEAGISDHFAFGLWNASLRDLNDEGVYYMPLVRGATLNTFGGIPTESRSLLDEFTIALCKLNFAGFYHPDILDWPRPAYQNLVLTETAPRRVVAVDIDINVRLERIPKSHPEVYGYHPADQWLWFHIATTNGEQDLRDRAYPEKGYSRDFTPISMNSALWLGAVATAPRLRAVALACVEKAKASNEQIYED